MTDGRKKHYIVSVRGIKHPKATIFTAFMWDGEAEMGAILTFTTCKHVRQWTTQQRTGRVRVKNPVHGQESTTSI